MGPPDDFTALTEYLHQNSNLQRTNLVLDEKEADHVRKLLDQEERTLGTLKKSIVETKNTLLALSGTHASIKERIRSYRRCLFFSTPKRLPPEIVQEIFRHCMASNHPDELPSPFTAPLLLTQICSAWRRIALNTPDLWRNVVLEFRGFSTAESVQELAKLWIERCGSRPYSIRLSSHLLPVHEFQIGNPLPDLLRHKPTSISALDLELPADYLQYFNDLPLETQFENLESISVIPLEPESENSSLWFHTTPLFESASKLKKIQLELSTNIYELSALRFPWWQLTHLVIESADGWCPHDMLAVFKQCKMLQTCDIGIDTQGVELEDNLHFPQMEKLTLRLPNFVLFDSLDIPSLKSLSIYLDTPPRQLTPIIPLINFHRRCNLKLEKLALGGTHPIDEVLSLLQLISESGPLRELSLTFMETIPGTTVIQYLTIPRDTTRPIFPDLENLWLGVREDANAISLIVELLESRGWSNDHPSTSRLRLLSIFLTNGCDISPRWREPLEPFVDRGLELITMPWQ